MMVEVFARTATEAAESDAIYTKNAGRPPRLPRKAGVVVLIDDQSDVLESRAAAEALIEQIRKAADELWPVGD